ncbi:uncharacterized protein LOC133035396 [Cannabis sativa]|uniref:uncharacterized protein LOC133035396 n=1 Tax=Cannabis sativa TaxID=3483 RepID=UPI0029CA50AE|nr:uncharacterized protein LOC133035396 [Cannabis sativa]
MLFHSECPLKKALQAAKLVCANSNYTAAKYKVDEELKKRRREIFESARIEKEREQREEIEKNVNLQRQKDREEQEKIRAAKFVRANSNYTATKYKIDEELKKRRRKTFENARIEKEREERERIANLQRKERAEREEKEKMENLQRLIRERKAHLALIEKVTQVEDTGENMKDYLELEKLCGYKPWFRYVPRNSKWEIFSSSNILNGTPLKKLGLFLKNEEEEEEKLYRQPIKKLRKA